MRNQAHIAWRAGLDPLLVVLITIALALAGAASLGAATKTWDGSSSGLWNVSANWTGNVAPVANDILIFPAGVARQLVTNNLAAATDFNGFGIRDDYTLRGSAVDLTNAIATAGSGTAARVELGVRQVRACTFDAAASTALTLGPLNLNAFTATMVADGDLTVEGVISGTGSGSRITKTGSGSLVLGAANTYAGITTVSAGTLIVNGAVTGAVNVASAGTLGGLGMVGTATNVAGAVTPGHSSAGILTISGPLSFGSLGALHVELGGTVAGTTYDQLRCQGTVNLGSAGLQITRIFGYTPALGTVFTILDKTSAGAITNTFANLPQNGILIADGVAYRISYTGGTGNDVTLTVAGLLNSSSVWDGGGPEGYWAMAINWSGDTFPVPGTILEFPRTAPDAICTNDFPLGTLFNSLLFSGAGEQPAYPILRGKEIQIATGLSTSNLTGSGVCAVELPLTLVAHQVFSNDSTAVAIELRSNVVIHPNGLEIAGPGTFRATGVVTNTGVGSLTVNGGHLFVNGRARVNTSIDGNGELGGTGTVGDVSIVDGELSAGESGPGLLTVADRLIIYGGSRLAVDLAGTAPGAGYDQIVCNTPLVTLAGFPSLVIQRNPNYIPALGTVFTIINKTTPGVVQYWFAGLQAEGSITNVDNVAYAISYVGGDGNDVTLTVGGGQRPAVTTQSATYITGVSGSLRASLASNGLPTQVYFDYGPTTNYGSRSPTNVIPAVYPVSLPLTQFVSGLMPQTTYHFRAVAGNYLGSATGIDLTFPTPAYVPPVLTRGPYLQSGTTSSIVVCWRSPQITESFVRYGTAPNALTLIASNTVPGTNHFVTLDDLSPGTRYYYSVGDSATISGSAADYYFKTRSTQPGPTRVWAIGDSGTATYGASFSNAVAAMRNAYTNFAGARPADVWLMLGDNAYGSGLDNEYQTAVFNMFPVQLRNTVVWPTIGNHETYSTGNFNSFPYLDIFSPPTAGQAGGMASGTKKYYSFDHGNVHFVCLDSMTSDRTTTAVGSMTDWLTHDLEATTNDWIIAFWHHPPYTKGTHDSDNSGGDFELVEMRSYVLPVLESHGVDLVLGGHSHAYERSYLLNGHYGFSSSLAPTMKVDGGDGREDGTGAYRRSDSGPTAQGTVYVVAGSSGQSGNSYGLNHPAMFKSLARLGSMVIDVDTNRLDAKFLRDTGAIDDYFTILKGVGPDSLRMARFVINGATVSVAWKSVAGETYQVEKTPGLETPNWQDVSGPITATGATSFWTGPATPGATEAYTESDKTNIGTPVLELCFPPCPDFCTVASSA